MPGFRKKLKTLFRLKKTKVKSPPPTTTVNSTPDTPTPPKPTLSSAARERNLPGVEKLLSQSQPEPTEIQDALTVAANAGHDGIILLLLQQDGIDVNRGNSKGTLPLHRAIHGGYGKAVRLLIEHGADPFRGSPSAIELAERLWKQRPLDLLYEIVDERYPGKRKKKEKKTKKPERLGIHRNTSEFGAVTTESPMPTASSPSVPKQSDILTKGTASSPSVPKQRDIPAKGTASSPSVPKQRDIPAKGTASSPSVPKQRDIPAKGTASSPSVPKQRDIPAKGTASSPSVPNQRDILAKGTASNVAWPDRVLFRKGEKIVLQPSDPSYWN